MIEILAFLVMIASLSLLILVHEAGHYFAARWCGLLVEEFGFGYPPRIFGKKIGDTIISLNWLPFGGFVRIFGYSNLHEEQELKDQGRSFSNLGVFKRIFIVIAGVLMNFLFGWILLSIVFMVGIPQSLLITNVTEGGIADSIGIEIGDQIMKIKSVNELVNYINENKGKEISLEIKRGDEDFIKTLIPRINVPDNEGNLGINLVETGHPKQNFMSAVISAFIASLSVLWNIFLGFIELIVGAFTDWSVFGKFVGPVGIVNVAVETTKLGVIPFIQFLSFISLNLVILNLLPIPALDGGKFMFLIIEKIKGTPVSQKFEMIASAFGFLFLISLLLIITIKDILMLF